MRLLFVLSLACLLCACATPWARVKEARTIEEARQLLGAYEPQVTQYPPNAEAWHFGKNECLLFVDGKKRLAKSTRSETSYPETGRVEELQQKNAILCTPSALVEDP